MSTQDSDITEIAANDTPGIETGKPLPGLNPRDICISEEVYRGQVIETSRGALRFLQKRNLRTDFWESADKRLFVSVNAETGVVIEAIYYGE